jgi:hypothetical protein
VEESRTSLSIIIFPTYVTLHYIHTYVFFRLSLARGTVSQHLHGMAWPGRPCFASLSMAGGQAGRQAAAEIPLCANMSGFHGFGIV